MSNPTLTDRTKAVEHANLVGSRHTSLENRLTAHRSSLVWLHALLSRSRPLSNDNFQYPVFLCLFTSQQMQGKRLSRIYPITDVNDKLQSTVLEALVGSMQLKKHDG